MQDLPQFKDSWSSRVSFLCVTRPFWSKFDTSHTTNYIKKKILFLKILKYWNNRLLWLSQNKDFIENSDYGKLKQRVQRMLRCHASMLIHHQKKSRDLRFCDFRWICPWCYCRYIQQVICRKLYRLRSVISAKVVFLLVDCPDLPDSSLSRAFESLYHFHAYYGQFLRKIRPLILGAHWNSVIDFHPGLDSWFGRIRSVVLISDTWDRIPFFSCDLNFIKTVLVSLQDIRSWAKQIPVFFDFPAGSWDSAFSDFSSLISLRSSIRFCESIGCFRKVS
jgi:hypothetical protein